MYKIKNLVTDQFFNEFAMGYFWDNNGDTFDTFENAKWVQQFYNLHNSAIVEVE